MDLRLKITNLLRTPVYLGEKGVELGLALFTLPSNFTFGQFVDGVNHGPIELTD